MESALEQLNSFHAEDFEDVRRISVCLSICLSQSWNDGLFVFGLIPSVQRACAHMHVCTQARTHACMHARKHVRAHARTHIHRVSLSPHPSFSIN